MIRVYLIKTDRFKSDVIKNFTLLINTRISKNNDVKYSFIKNFREYSEQARY